MPQHSPRPQSRPDKEDNQISYQSEKRGESQCILYENFGNPFDFFKVPPSVQLTTSLNGGSIALMEVVEMAALGKLKILVDRYPFSAVKQAYDDFEHGRLVGRAVVMPVAEARAA